MTGQPTLKKALWLSLSLLFVLTARPLSAQHTDEGIRPDDAFHDFPVLDRLLKDTLKHARSVDLETNTVSTTLTEAVVSKGRGTAAGLLNRSSGMNFVYGSLLSVRGLNPRYAQITVDGLSAPITEQTIKAFSLGLLPGGSIGSLQVRKSGDFADYGEWAGALVAFESRGDLTESYNEFTIGLGYQWNVTFEDGFYKDSDYPDGFGDFLGYGVKKRRFTDDLVDSETLQTLNRNDAAAEGAKLNNTWAIEEGTALPNFNISYEMGRVLFQNGESRLSTHNTFSFARSHNGVDYNRARYTKYKREDDGTSDGGAVASSSIQNYMTDNVNSIDADLAASSIWNWRKNNHNNFKFNASYGHSGSNQCLTRYYISPVNKNDVIASSVGLLSKGILMLRLSGDHQLTDRTSVDWNLGYNKSDRDEPDLRRSGAQRNLGETDSPYFIAIPESSKADAGARFSSELNESTVAGRVDLTHEFGGTFNKYLGEVLDDENPFVKARMNDPYFVQTRREYGMMYKWRLRTGGIFEVINRDFSVRLVTPAKDDFTAPDLRFVPATELGNVFAPENFGPLGYFLADGSRPEDSYESSTGLYGAYAGLDWRVNNRWEISGGLRVESFGQQLDADTVSVDRNTLDALPYLNFKLNPNMHWVIKAGYSRSVNRPAFRELAPFQFYDFDYRSNIAGNTNLINAKVDNLDFTALYLFGRNEYVGFSPFFKYISNPIEMVYRIQADNPLFTFDNVKAARISGFEFEINKFMSNNLGSLMSQFLINGSLAYTYSSVELGEDTQEATSSRQLQGQVPLIINAGLTFISENKRFNTTLGYRFTSNNLFSVGDGISTFPWYNKRMHIMNYSAAYQFTQNLKINFGINNLLNTPMVQIEDANLDGDIETLGGADKEVQRGLRYQTFVISANVKF
ncbi:MAG: TonB-dependent receptor domain-containing protein [Saprospiraceae bacterium]